MMVRVGLALSLLLILVSAQARAAGDCMKCASTHGATCAHWTFDPACLQNRHVLFDSMTNQHGSTPVQTAFPMGNNWTSTSLTTLSGLPGLHASRPLVPARVYLRGSDITRTEAGAYGVVALRGRANPATRAKLLMVCTAFVTYLPRQADLPASVKISDQMLTIWPLDDPGSPKAAKDDCDFDVDDYDVYGGQSAIADANRQGAHLDGEGPFLIGWSPSNTRGVPDKLVLVVNLSNADSQQSINELFLFWQKKSWRIRPCGVPGSPWSAFVWRSTTSWTITEPPSSTP